MKRSLFRSLAGLSWIVGAYTIDRVGIVHAAMFSFAQGVRVDPYGIPNLLRSLWYTVPVLLIIAAHEYGHIAAAERYHAETTGPFLFPWPLAWSVPGLQGLGTAGAFVRVEGFWLSSLERFDIASEGFLMGFGATVLFTILGFHWSVPLVGAHVTGHVWTPGPIAFWHEAAAWHPVLYAARVGWLITTVSLFVDMWTLIPAFSAAWRTRKCAVILYLGVACLCLASR